MKPLFQRMNFFRGLFTKAEDWQREQSYHIEKHKLHSRCFHTPGVVTGKAGDGDLELKESLRVSATPGGSITVQPGYAVDGHGRDLYLSKGEELDITPDPDAYKGKDEVLLFIYIAHREIPTEKRDIYTDPGQSDHAFIEESPIVKWTDREPDNKEKIELARIKWKHGRRITQEHIDASRVKHAGTKHVGPFEEFIQLKDDTTVVPAAEGPEPAGERERILEIDFFKEQAKASGVLYLANVFPVEPKRGSDEKTRVRWRIESSINNEGEVRYNLFLQGFGTKPVRVRYQVYRLKIAT